MRHRYPRTFPFAPLEPLLAGSNATKVLRISARTLTEYRRYGLNATQADRLACRLGRHPFEVWGPAWYGLREAVPV